MWNRDTLFTFEKLSQTPEESLLAMTVSENLPFFEGHFPDNPTLPGIAIIDATLVAIKQHWGGSGNLKSVPSAKFLALIKPGDKLTLRITKTHEKTWKTEWEATTDGKTEKKAELTTELW